LPDADRSALPWKTIVADVDVKIARIDAVSGLRAHRDIAKTGGVPTTNTQIAPLTLTSGFISILPFRFPPRVDSAIAGLKEASANCSRERRVFYGRAKFCCKMVQSYATHCEC